MRESGFAGGLWFELVNRGAWRRSERIDESQLAIDCSRQVRSKYCECAHYRNAESIGGRRERRDGSDTATDQTLQRIPACLGKKLRRCRVDDDEPLLPR